MSGSFWPAHTGEVVHAEESGEEDTEHYKKGHYTVSSKSFAIVTGHQGNYMLFSRSIVIYNSPKVQMSMNS